MASSVPRIKELLEKTKNYDADERFMAMHDLVEQLKALTLPLDAALQVPVRDTILRLLNDGSSDVATVSVKWSAAHHSHIALSETASCTVSHASSPLPPSAALPLPSLSQLVTKLNPTEIAYITDRLGTLISSPDSATASSSSSSSYGRRRQSAVHVPRHCLRLSADHHLFLLP